MSQDILGYSSHDWRKHTDDAVVMDSWGGAMLRVNDSKVDNTQYKINDKLEKRIKTLEQKVGK